MSNVPTLLGSLYVDETGSGPPSRDVAQPLL